MKAIRNRAALAALIVAVPLAMLPPSAVGGSVGGNGGATEVTQLLNNAELAMQTIQDEIRNLTMMKQLATDVMQQIPLGEEFAGLYAEAKAAYQEVSGAVGAAQRLYGSVSNLKETVNWRMQQFSASGLPWNDYLKRETDFARMRHEQITFLSQGELQAAAAVESAFRDLQAYQQRIGQTSGTHQAMGLMNAQVNSLLALTATGIANANNHYQAATVALAEEAGARERAMKDADAVRKAQEAANQRGWQRLGGK